MPPDDLPPDRSERPATLLAQAGRRKALTRGLVSPPVCRASTVLFDDVEALRSAGQGRDGVLQYGRNGTPTQWALAEALTALEPGAAGTRLFPSGVAAISMALLSVLRPGDALLMTDSVYGPTRAFCDTVLRSMGIETVYYDPLIGRNIASPIEDRTRAIFMESPGSLTFEVQDVPGISAVAKERGLVTLLDNAWATSLFFPAVEAGVDLAILPCTKYIAGHGDLMLGAVTAAPDAWPALEKTARSFGQCVSPDDAWLALRGLRTLEVRLKRHEQSALEVARWLEQQPQVARVLHPALPGCPGHEHWTRHYRGSSGLFSFVLNGGDDAERTRLIDSLQHFGIGYSWGGFESLVLPVDPDRLRTATATQWEGPLVRLHIGLEDPHELIEDLGVALSAYGE